MKYKIGSNQHHSRRRFIKGRTWLLILIVIAFVTPSTVVGYSAQQDKPVELTKPIPFILDVNAGSSAEFVQPLKEDSPKKEEIEAYIKTIFGKESRVAIAVSHNECSPRHPDYPRCVLKTEHEYSVGLFQINLQSAYAKVHYNRIPGDTLAEKVEWLKDPMNNTLAAYWIYTKSDWNPWTAYTSGNYLKDL